MSRVCLSACLTRCLLTNQKQNTHIYRGVSLSGGQKARVSLARALYDDADIVLLDDPLAAVDAHVTKALFDTAITGVLHDKTRILVLSSNYHLLAQADQVVVMEGRRVLGVGTYQELLPRFPRFFDTGNGGSSPNPPQQQEGQGQGQEAQERSLALSPIPGRHVVTLEELGKSARLDKMESMPVLGGDKAAALMEKEVRRRGSRVGASLEIQHASQPNPPPHHRSPPPQHTGPRDGQRLLRHLLGVLRGGHRDALGRRAAGARHRLCVWPRPGVPRHARPVADQDDRGVER